MDILWYRWTLLDDIHFESCYKRKGIIEISWTTLTFWSEEKDFSSSSYYLFEPIRMKNIHHKQYLIANVYSRLYLYTSRILMVYIPGYDGIHPCFLRYTSLAVMLYIPDTDNIQPWLWWYIFPVVMVNWLWWYIPLIVMVYIPGSNGIYNWFRWYTTLVMMVYSPGCDGIQPWLWWYTALIVMVYNLGCDVIQPWWGRYLFLVVKYTSLVAEPGSY